MDQHEAPIVDALAAIERRSVLGFGAPGHHQAAAIPHDMKRLLGRNVFLADVNTPRGLDDRREGGHVVQRAHEIAAEAWGADFARFVTGGSTQSLQIALAAVARPGETVLMAANVHKAERSYALAAGLATPIVPVIVDAARDIEHGVAADALAAALDAHPDAKAFVLVSPTYYGVTSDIAALADLCHERGVPLICDAAWGGAFAFSEELPHDALTKGADVTVYSLHKTMGALSQGSALLAKGVHVDLQRLALAYELFATTSPSIPILASLDATRRDHALQGPKLWSGVVALAQDLRTRVAGVRGLKVLGEDDLPPGAQLDPTKVLIDMSALGITAYAADDWLSANHRISIGLSTTRYLLAIVSLGTTASNVRALARALGALAKAAADAGAFPPVPAPPPLAELSMEFACPGADALFAPAELVRIEDAAGRVAAEMIAPAPPGVPRLVPGQRITPAHVAWLVANRDAGAFFLDPADPSERRLRVVA